MFFADDVQFHYPPDFRIEPEYKLFRAVKDTEDSPGRLEKIFKPENLYRKHTRKAFLDYL